MNKIRNLILTAALILCSVSVNALEESWAPYQVSVVYPVQVVEEKMSIKGIRYNFIYGINKNMKGLDFGMINAVSNEQSGLQLGLINSTFKSKGVQIGIINKTEYLEGLQIGILNFHNEGNMKLLPIVNWAF